MAGATRSKTDSTVEVEVVDILNNANTPQSQTLGKRKRRALPRRPGRPIKKAPSAEEEDVAAAEGAYITPASTGGEGVEDISKGGAGGSTTKLRKPKDCIARRQRRSTIKMSHGTDVYTTPESPETASSAVKRRVEGGEYSLQNSVFHGVASSKVPEADFAQSPSQGTRSKYQSADASSRHPKQQKAAAPVRIMRRLPPRAPAADSMDNESLDAGIDRMLPLRNNVTRSQNPLKIFFLAEKTTTTISDDVGYSSPQKVWKTGPAACHHAANKRTRKAPSKAAEQDIEEDEVVDRGGEEDEEDEEGDREGRGNKEQEMEEEGGGGDEAEEGEEDNDDQGEEEEDNDDQEDEEEHEEASSDQQGDRQPRPPDQPTAGSPERQSNDTIAVTHNAQPKPPKRQSRFEKAANIHKCAEHWKIMWDAAKDIQVLEDPETTPVRELLAAMRKYREIIRNASRESLEGDEDLLSDSNGSDLGKIATVIGSLKKSSSQTGREENRLIRDIYLHVIPCAVELLRSILVVRAVNGDLNIAALEELIMILKATRRLCERLYHWKPTLHLDDETRSTTNLKIKLSLRPIEVEYKKALSDLRRAKYEAEAKIRQEEFAMKQEMLIKAQKQEILDRRREFADWMQRHTGERQTQKVTQLRHGTRRRDISEAHEVYDLDDLDDLDVHESTRESDDDFIRGSTEEIPKATKRVWRSEEKLALLVLLQKHRGPDRYEKIQEAISDISRFIRRYGPDNFMALGANSHIDLDLAGAADVLDDLGIMEVSDIRERAKYLKAAQAETMARDLKDGCGREKWSWLLSV
ncbi:hypothetical protein EPUS_04746 [Endocarpon pusillum Z07020]|uniref:Uncharacterized protein n=1 Tax=Endocarpon pusillum (strain Z07020 / HMAS-L-300199) TaxID=1263415 RepID=U1GEF0_ENDPU|nr:uncharacterized protein EPUS_04746 [Endocarpon pusillum Z07020]ERF70468.1 hypothetical protein EPUS_04746 [Endocarpon pusillum Z07020]